MRAVLIGGGNLGDVGAGLAAARGMIEARVGAVEAASGVYESEPWGFEAPQRFLNQVWVVETPLEPLALLDELEDIERALGRTDKGGKAEGVGQGQTRAYLSRTMDIDILFYGRAVIDTPRLKVPHPLLHEREFVLRPLREVAGGVVHPVLGRKVEEL